MTRTDVMASSRPRTAGAASKRRGPSLRVLAIFPVVLLMAMALLAPGAAFAATETTKSGYNQEPEKPSTGTSPSKETSEPSKEEPASETTPSTTTTPSAETAKTLPFTGFDLRWSFGVGLLLMGAGFSIVVVQRRQRREGGR
jgi:cytoskeletal protein RodZ